MNTYTRPTGQVDHVLQPVSRVVKPVTQLYGVNGKAQETTLLHSVLFDHCTSLHCTALHYTV